MNSVKDFFSFTKVEEVETVVSANRSLLPKKRSIVKKKSVNPTFSDLTFTEISKKI